MQLPIGCRCLPNSDYCPIVKSMIVLDKRQILLVVFLRQMPNNTGTGWAGLLQLSNFLWIMGA